jgi:hypothetical protein
LIFEFGSTQGLLIEVYNGPVVNLATIGLNENGLKIEETHGAVYSYEMVKKLVNKLAGLNFLLLVPLRFKCGTDKFLDQYTEFYVAWSPVVFFEGSGY